MKKFAYVLAVLAVMSASGCAQKSESEKMMDAFKKDAKTATNNMQKEIDKL